MTGKKDGFSHFDSDPEMQSVAIITTKYLTPIMTGKKYGITNVLMNISRNYQTEQLIVT
jgi:hypothetical protein